MVLSWGWPHFEWLKFQLKAYYHPVCKNQKGKWAQSNSSHQRGKEPQRGESKRKWTQSSLFKLSLSLWISPKARMCGHTGSSFQLKHKGVSWDLSCCSSEEGQCGVCIQTTQLPGENKTINTLWHHKIVSPQCNIHNVWGIVQNYSTYGESRKSHPVSREQISIMK